MKPQASCWSCHSSLWLPEDIFTLGTLVPTEIPVSARGRDKPEQFLWSSCNTQDGNVDDDGWTVVQSKQVLWKHTVSEPRDQEVLVLCIWGPSSGSRGITQFQHHRESYASLIDIVPIHFWTHKIQSTEYLCLKDKFKVTRIKENHFLKSQQQCNG